MTYKEWFTLTGTRFGISEAEVELILANQAGCIPDADAPLVADTAKRALCAEFASVMPMANVSEGGYSVSWNWEAVRFWYTHTCGELGITPAGTPKVRNRSNLW